MARFAAVGAGRMGRTIALAVAYAGHRVALIDLRARSPESWDRLRRTAQNETEQALAGLVKLGVMPPDLTQDVAARIDLVAADRAPAALNAAELLFEGVSETPEAKREAFDIINAHVRGDAIITSTTSSMRATDLARQVRQPERFLNLHWLNPAYVIPLVELGVHPGTDQAVVDRTRALMESLGKVPVVCRDAPGYIVPRLQALILNEVARMIEEGVATPDEIDKATRFGLGLRFSAIGAVEFLDYGGCDILHHVSRELTASIGPRYAAPAIVGQMFEQGLLGLKSGRGFYDYAGKDIAAYRHDVLARTVSALRNAGLWRSAVAKTLS